MTGRKRAILTFAGVTALAALVTAAVPGATYALWHDELETTGVIADAATIFEVDGTAATSAAPSVGVPLGPEEAQILLDEHDLAVAVEVRALSQGNRGLRYTVDLDAAEPDSIFASAQVAVFPVPDAAACTTAAALPESTPTSSTPVPAGYSDSAVPEVEFWCVRAHLDKLPDEGKFQSWVTITGTSAFGEVSELIFWNFTVLTAFRAAAEPEREVTFTYETFR